MRRLVTFLAVAILVVCAAQVLYLYALRDTVSATAPWLPRSPGAEAPQREVSAFEEAGRPLQPNESHSVDFSADETSFQELTPREQEDQYRDWLLFTAVAALQPSAEEYNRIFFDLPTIRHGYMRPVGTFEFGDTRSRSIGDGKVLALLPAGRSETERRDLLAHIADEQRKNQGGEFNRLIVVEYDLDVEHQRAVLARRGDIEYATLFSAGYGYHEKTVAKLADLEEFMATVDDLTAVTKTSDGLLLGGRKVLSRKYRSITVEQVATVWQAEQKIQEALTAWETYVRRVEDDFRSRWSKRTYRGDHERRQLEKELELERQQIEERLARERHDLELVNGSGFSLDPAIDYSALKEAFDLRLPELQSMAPETLSQERAGAVSRALAEGNIVPFRQLVGTIERAGPSLAGLAFWLTQIERTHSYQAARYDGALQGTEVGMVLFYTDLLAKLWVIDFVNSSPRRDRIHGFIDDPTAPRSLIYEAETDELSYARLWFGHSNLGFQVADQKRTVFLARNATRIYSAGSNPENPGVETETSVFLAASTDWWNDHYEEIARYEQEYERLNQIMKWSIVIGWLNEFSEGTKLRFLADVKNDRSKIFPDWVSHHQDLRFQQWSDVQFYPAGYKGTTTEALPLLSGPVTTGGVSLATKDVAKRAPIAREVEKTALRSNLDYAATSGKDALTTLDGAVFTLKTSGVDRFSVVARAKPKAKFRATTAQLAHTDIERTVIARADTVRLETRAADTPLGDLQISRSPNGFAIGWRAREVDRAHSLALAVSKSPDPDLSLLRDPTVEAVVKFPGDASYAVKLRDSPRWVRLAPEQQPTVDIAEGWQLRAAGHEGQAFRSMQASVIEDAQLQAAIGKQKHFVIEASNDGRPFLRLSPEDAPVGTRVIELDGGDVRVEAWVQPPSNNVHLGAGGQGGSDVIAIARRLGPDEIDAIRKAAANSNNRVVRLPDTSRIRAKLADDLQNSEYRKAAVEIANDPNTARLVIEEEIRGSIKRNTEILRTRGPDEALHDLDRLLAIYGNRPELTLRRGIVQIERGNVEAAVESAGMTPPRLPSDRKAFFDEVNARLVDGPADARANLLRYAEYADWRDLMAQPARAHDLGSIRPVAIGNRFDFELRLAAMPPGEQVSLAELGRSHAASVYSQESVGLNSLDWTGSVDQALRQVITGSLGRVVRLPQQDIAHFRPSVIWSPDNATAFKAVQAQSHTMHMPASGYQPCSVEPELCSNDDTRGEQREAYLVVAN